MGKKIKKNKDSDVPECDNCDAKCCKYVALQIDTPDCKEDYDNIRWYLRHRDVHVFIDHEDDWCIEFKAVCDDLGEDNKCAAYETRPGVCRTHGLGTADCEFFSESHGDPYQKSFATAEEFEDYLDEQGIKWRIKAHK